MGFLTLFLFTGVSLWALPLVVMVLYTPGADWFHRVMIGIYFGQLLFPMLALATKVSLQ